MKALNLLLLLLFVSGCAAPLPYLEQYPFCLEDEDCREGEICVREFCQRKISCDGDNAKSNVNLTERRIVGADGSESGKAQESSLLGEAQKDTH